MENLKPHQKKSCCFTGHRNLANDKKEIIFARLSHEIERLIKLGVNTYYSGGALGFDQMAASIIIQKRDEGKDISLVFALPYRSQDEFWYPKQKILYRNLLNQADKIIYVSDTFDKDCMKRRNYYMVENSAYCICALFYKRSGTFQTVNYAVKNGLEIVNIANYEAYNKSI